MLNFIKKILGNSSSREEVEPAEREKTIATPLDKRTCPRYGVQWTMSLYGGTFFVETRSEDLSYNGMRLFFREQVELPEEILVSFDIPKGHGPTSGRLVRAVAKIAHIAPSPSGTRVGLVFSRFEKGGEDYGWALSTLHKINF